MLQSRFLLIGILLLLLGCEPESSNIPVLSTSAKLEEYGFFDFKVEGVSTANISILKDRLHSVLIRLPPDYKGGNKIKVSFRNWEKILADPSNSERGWKNGSIIYEGNRISIAANRYTGGPDIDLYVISYAPTEILSNDKPYIISLSSPDTLIKLRAKNWGTDWTPYDGDYRVQLIHKTSGIIIGSFADASLPEKEGEPTPVRILISRYMQLEEGVYKVVVFSNGKEVVAPDELIVQDSKPEMSRELGVRFVTDTNRTLTFWGRNFIENNTYELVLRNDFVKERKFTLSRNNSKMLTVVLPQEVLNGNYLDEILINGQPILRDNVLETDNITIVQNDARQTQLISLTDYSQKYTTSQGLVEFKPITKFKRGSELMAITHTPNALSRKDKKLYLKDITSDKEYILNHDYLKEFSPSVYSEYSFFPIPMDVPPGQYEVRVSTVPDGVTTYFSERYHRIIKIE